MIAKLDDIVVFVPVTAKLVDVISVNALSTSTLALMSNGVLNIFVPALDWNVVVEVLIVTTSEPMFKSSESECMFTLAVNTVLESMFVSVPVIAKLVDVISVIALSISKLELMSADTTFT